jgi:dimeric dUTPase (all-alpha-NTP-PPase superfamily)
MSGQETPDRLAQIFDLQKKLMDKVNVPYPERLGRDLSEQQLYFWTQELSKAIAHEAMELEDWTPWKHWSKRLGNKVDIVHMSPEHLEEMRREIVDLFHFVLEVAIIHGMTETDMYDAYVAKNVVNHERQERGGY